MCPRDTSPEAWRVFVELQRRMTPEEKLRQTLEFSDAIRQIAEIGLRQRYPDADDREFYLRKAQLILGRELALQVFGVSFDDDRIHQGT